METIDTPEPVAAVVQPDTLRVKAHFPQATIAIKSTLWHNWTVIALRAEARAVLAHEYGLTSGDIGTALEGVNLETMVTVSAVRHTFHHLYQEWQPMLALRSEG